MDGERWRRLAREAIDGYQSGPDAPIAATRAALDLARNARAVLLVEGISDQIALETLAGRLGRDLATEGVVVVPIGGAQAIAGHLARFGPDGAGIPVTGLCDAGEERYFRRALARAGLGRPRDRTEMERLGFFVCVDDLEQELIRACGRQRIEALLDSQGDLAPFRTLQAQPAWRGRDIEAQLHRWLRAGAGRNLRYARLLVQATPSDRFPPPLKSVLAATGS